MESRILHSRFFLALLQLTILSREFSLVVVLVALQICCTNGVLTFWDSANFSGKKYQIWRPLMGQTCYNDYVGQPSSITWEGLPTTGFFDGKSKIAFYTDSDCVGDVRAWFTTEKDFPTNLTLDGIDNSIKSFMLWQLNKKPRVYDYPDK